MKPLRGVIFDLDGTLVDSRLDFSQMRLAMGIPEKEPILEYLATLDEPSRIAKEKILDAFELEGAMRATLFDGVRELLDTLQRWNIETAIFTRNSKKVTTRTLERLELTGFSQLVTRECAPPKPLPDGLNLIRDNWAFEATEVVYVGDYLFDLEAGRNAGIETALFLNHPNAHRFSSLASFCFCHFSELTGWLENKVSLTR